MIRVSEIKYLPKEFREEFEKFDKEINFLKNVCEDLRTYKRMISFRKYD
jgi:hypothetical protein